MIYNIYKLNQKLMTLKFQPIWFDSIGAKSSCTLVKTPDISVLIDPGITVMHPSFPASNLNKILWMKKGENAIKKACKEVDVIVISHYHYDHFFPEQMNIYKGKTVFIKNPNEYITDSQRNRAEKLFENIMLQIVHNKSEKLFLRKRNRRFVDHLKELTLANKKDFKAYTKRRNELLEKSRPWFRKRVDKWNSNKQIIEIDHSDIKIIFPENKKFNFGNTTLRFSGPLFHGIEFSRVGWVFSTLIEYDDYKLIHTSDLNGPIIEDYAKMIIKENPDVLILDGPMTYMYGYLLNKTNLNRAIENATRIVEEIDAKVIIYDHHLPREIKFRDRTRKVWDTAKKYNKNLITAVEFLGEKTVVEKNSN
jgi:predicted metallo-beta-lactamase superfamily hydrolase